MDSVKINLKILKSIIFQIAENNGSSLSDIARKRKIDYNIVEEQSVFLIDMGLLEYIGATPHAKRIRKGEPGVAIQFKQDLETIQKIANFLDIIELSRFMKTKYYTDNLQYYCIRLINSLNEYKLTPLPDVEYLEYAIKNSPSNVRFFLVDNDIRALRSFYQRYILNTHEKFKGRIKTEVFKKYDMYIIWENVIFGKIQEDLQNEVLLEPVNYFAGYLPLAKKTLEKLLEIASSKDETENSFSRLQKYFEVLLD